jgi:hypothetical protein
MLIFYRFRLSRFWVFEKTKNSISQKSIWAHHKKCVSPPPPPPPPPSVVLLAFFIAFLGVSSQGELKNAIKQNPGNISAAANKSTYSLEVFFF